MTNPTDPAGRRANGLPAADWGALVDLDPRLSAGMLDRLAAAGVAAYVEPATAVDTVHRAVTMPSRPLDRLWVDPSRADAAREIVASEVADLTALLAEDDPGATAHGLVHPIPRYAARRVLPPPLLPGPPVPPFGQVPADAGAPGPTLSDDDVFADLVARFHSDEVFERTAEASPHGPAAEDLSGPGTQPRRRRHDPPASPPAVEPLPSWVEPDALDDDGHYVPPPPPPVPRVRLRTIAAVASIVLGLLVLFAPAVVGLSATHEVGVLGLALLAGGAGALVWWMRDSSDSGPDDGAVV